MVQDFFIGNAAFYHVPNGQDSRTRWCGDVARAKLIPLKQLSA
jgi:hypothetical protein